MPKVSSSSNDNSQAKSSDSPGRMGRAWKILLFLFVTGVVLQHILGGDIGGAGGRRMPFVLTGLVVFLATVGAGFKTSWRRFLSSNSFAVPVLIALSLLAALGTMILQGKPEQFMNRYYGSAAKVISTFFLGDIFHSLGFAAVLCAGAAGMALTVCRRRKPKLRYLGSVGAHLGLLVVLAGAAIGNVWVTKGRLELRKGQSKNHFLVDSPHGTAKVAFGFSVRLDDFHLDMYEPEYSLMVLDISGDDEKVLLKTDPLKPDNEALANLGLELEGFWPDHDLRMMVTPSASSNAPTSRAPAALNIVLQKDTETASAWFFAYPGSKPHRKRILGDLIVFAFDENQASLAMESASTGPHQLIVGAKTIGLQVGKETVLPDGRKVKLKRFLPDFVLDSDTGEPRTRSQEPNNPAVELEVYKDTESQDSGPESTWLFDRFPDFHHKGQKPVLQGISYKFKASSAGKWTAVISAKARKIWARTKGTQVKEFPLQKGTSIALHGGTLKVADFYASAQVRSEDFSRTKRQNNPLARIKRTNKPGTADVTPDRPVKVHDSTVVLLSPSKGEMVRDYVSTLSIWEDRDGEFKRVAKKKVEVNYPLEHNGFYIYQADYRPDDPDWSGFQVTRDSGLIFVYIGFSMNLLGVLLAVFSPVFDRRKKTYSAGAK